jgi:dTDP-4-amino-4,6-dideoxygalactose transaminase
VKLPAVLGGEAIFPDGLQFARPLTPDLDRVQRRLRPSYDRGVLTNGPLVRELEDAIAARLGVRRVVAVSSCTAGLMLAIRALGGGDYVVPSFTFSASAHAVAWNGGRPLFAECDPETFLLDEADAARRIDGASGVLATHVFGAPCNPKQLESLAQDAGVPLVFDAAHGLGGRCGGTPLGGFGDAEVFSLSPTKLLVAGEGGLVTTNRDDVADQVRIGRDYGNPGDYDTRFVGLNARMSEVHAAQALESLEQLDSHLARRRAIAAVYRDGLHDLPGVQPQRIADGDETTNKDFTIIIDAREYGVGRDVLADALKAEGIDTRKYFYPPVHRQQSYAGTSQPEPLPVTDDVAGRVLSLPMFYDLTDEAVNGVIEALWSVHAKANEIGAHVAG